MIYVKEGDNAYRYKQFTLKKDDETISIKHYSINDRTSTSLYSGDLEEGNYTFIYSGAYTEFQTAIMTFTYTFNFTIHHHDYTTQTIPPTCTESGYTRHTCLECGDYYDTDIISAAGHSYITVIENGMAKQQCSLCGDSYQDSSQSYPTNPKSSPSKHAYHLILTFFICLTGWVAAVCIHAAITQKFKKEAIAKRLFIIYTATTIIIFITATTLILLL